METKSFLTQLDGLPSSWKLCAVDSNKTPYNPDRLDGHDWQHNPIDKDRFANLNGRFAAIGVILGEASGGLIGVDHDGSSATRKIKELSGQEIEDALPKSVAVTSGRPGRYQTFYWVPEKHWPLISHTTFSCDPDEGLEFRWGPAKQSVILGAHPETDGYQWLSGQSPAEVDVARCPDWIIIEMMGRKKTKLDPPTYTGELSHPVPLVELLKKQHRKSIAKGETPSDTTRNVYGAALARDLIGCEQWCNENGIQFIGDARELFYEWCVAVGLDTDKPLRQPDTIWRSAFKSNPDPACCDYLLTVVKRYESVSDDDLNILDEIITARNFKPDIGKALHPKIMKPVTQISRMIAQHEAAVALPFLSIASSLLRVGTLVAITPSYTQPPVIWTALLGDSDAGKSPILGSLSAPIVKMKSDAFKRYYTELALYEIALETWQDGKKGERDSKPKPPAKPRPYFFDDFTIEAMASVINQHQDTASTVLCDELASFILGMGQYKKQSNDREKWLSLYDGGRLDVLRKGGDPIFAERTSISVVGSIQPEVLRSAMGDLTYVNGFWSRFCYAPMDHSNMPFIQEAINTGELSEIYRLLDSYQPQTYPLSPEALILWEKWHYEIEDYRNSHEHPGKRSVFRKARARAARFALLLHCVNAAANGLAQPPDQISLDTVKAGIELSRYSINMVLSVYDDFGAHDDADLNRIARFVQRFKGKGWIGARKVIHWWSPKPKPNTEEAQKFMQLLVDLNYAESNNQEGSKLKIKIENDGNKFEDYPNPLPERDLDEKSMVTKNGNKVTNFGNSDDRDDDDRDDQGDLLPCYHNLLPQENGLKLAPGVNLNSSDDLLPPSLSEKTENEKLLKLAPGVNLNSRDPRESTKIEENRIMVDLEKLDLDYVPEIEIPQWEPTATVTKYEEVKKLYLDIETTGLDPETCRITMIGLMDELGNKTIISDQDEAYMIKRFLVAVHKHNPELLIGHNLFKFDLPFIEARAEANKINCPFRKWMPRDSEEWAISTITSSSWNGKPIQFEPYYWGEISIIDTLHQVAIWDKQAAKLTGYGLKNCTIELGLRSDRRTELSNAQIQECWDTGNIELLSEYLGYDLEDTALLADYLLPVSWYQQLYVPGVKFQKLAIASPAFKAQKIHESLLPDSDPIPDEQFEYEGGKVDLFEPGLHSDVAKIDVSSLYPSIMLRYGLCSKKDPDHKFLGVLQYMTTQRLHFKVLAKQGDVAAGFQEKALKILINGSYGFFGTGKYSFNDYECAALVTAYGRKILDLMVDACTNSGGTPIEIDTDGLYFKSQIPHSIIEDAQKAMPTGINLELEMEGCGLFVPAMKNYSIVHPDGKLTLKGVFRKRNRMPLEKIFQVEYLKRYFLESKQVADAYYLELVEKVESGSIDLELLKITKKIATSDKTLTGLGFGQIGDTVSYWYAKQERFHKKTGKELKPTRIETQSEPYWADYYLSVLADLFDQFR